MKLRNSYNYGAVNQLKLSITCWGCKGNCRPWTRLHFLGCFGRGGSTALFDILHRFVEHILHANGCQQLVLASLCVSGMCGMNGQIRGSGSHCRINQKASFRRMSDHGRPQAAAGGNLDEFPSLIKRTIIPASLTLKECEYSEKKLSSTLIPCITASLTLSLRKHLFLLFLPYCS